MLGRRERFYEEDKENMSSEVESKGKIMQLYHYFMHLIYVCRDEFSLSLLYSQAYIMFLLCFLNIITDNYTDKKIITALLCCKNKRKGLHIPPIQVYSGTYIQEHSEARNVLEQLYPESFPSQQRKSRSTNNSMVAIRSIANFHAKGETYVSSLLMSPRVKGTGSLQRISIQLSAHITTCMNGPINFLFQISGEIYDL